ncbi:MAG: N-acetylmuramoyl-L-alanine amidase [Candidatus Acidiferrales bacterium]
MQFARSVSVLCIAALTAVSAQAPSPPAEPLPQDPIAAPPAAPLPTPVSVIVIDPAHGGADAGARGAASILEKDIVLHYALLLRDQLQRQGLRAVLTRQGAEAPAYDERAAIANSYRSALYISLHAGSTGPAGTARCYFDATATIATALQPVSAGAPIPWDRAQQPYAEISRRLAALIQAQLKQQFPNSPAEPAAIPVRPLRNVAAPAVAVEVSSVSAANREQLDSMAVPLAEAIARALAEFRGGGG